LPATLQHRLVPHRLVRELGEGGAPLDEHRGEKVGQAELGGIAIGGTMLGGERLP
jgi:hypothetical protein